MLYIKKGSAPKSLTEYKKKKYANYEQCNKADIRQALLEEQGHLCAYCMGRITAESMKIEHWYPECKMSDYECLDYNNMLGCCLGHLDGVPDICDSAKADKLITIDPRNKRLVEKVSYDRNTGRIFSNDATINYDLDEVLNLNSVGHNLMINRKSALDGFIIHMCKKKANNNWTSNDLRKVLVSYEHKDALGQKKPYSGIVIWYIEKRLKK